MNEAEVEESALQLLVDELGYIKVFGPDIAPAPDGLRPERETYLDVVLVDRLRRAIQELNPTFSYEVQEIALKKVLRAQSQDLLTNNHSFHSILVDGIDIDYREKSGSIKNGKIRLIDFDNPKKNEFLAINQFTIIENNTNRRPDIILFVNGLPLVVIELKNPSDENATIYSAFNQLQTYKLQIPSLFNFNEILVISDGLQAKAGTISANKERFLPWKTIDGNTIDPPKKSQLEVLIRGMLNKEVLLDLIQNFVVFEKEKEQVTKKVAAYHQYHATNKALETTLKATGPKGDKRAGVVWHTQGSGKSLTMAFYARKLVLAPKMENPTLVVLTDRNDLDDQLFDTFSACQELLRQSPVQAKNRQGIRELLKVASGGIIFTTIQKFFPEEKGDQFPLLSNRRNVVVIADEAHRSQYDFIDGFAKHMRDALPNASFIGFTGTPIENSDKSTRAVFGKDVSVYDINQAVQDGATVKIYYESRLAKLDLKPEERPRIDSEFEEITEGEESKLKEKLKSRWARMEALVGSPKRIRRIAKDIINHFETRSSVLEGKGMIVCMSRRICVDLHDELVKLKPDWYHKDDDKGFLKVVMTGSASDKLDWQGHIRNKLRRKAIKNTMKDPASPIKLVIVRDMWLTGFDAPCLHTMYLDKPMRGHGLMQAIARVNRVFKDKPGGLVVDYLGVATELKNALAAYTERDRKETGINQEEAVAILLEKYEIVKDLFHGFNYTKVFKASTKEKLAIIPTAADFVLKKPEGKKRCLKYVTELSKAFALAVPHEDALKLRDEIAFFQAVRSALAKTETGNEKQAEDLDSAIRQIVSNAVVSDRVIDIFAAAGLKKPDISILSEEFLAEVKDLPQKNLAFETLKKLLNDEIRIRQKKNLIQSKSFSEMLDKAIKRYQNKSIETAEVIEELIKLAKKMREEDERGVQLDLSEDEIAFYDALEVNDSAVKVLGDETLRKIARELAETIRKNTSIDWTIRESVQAELRLMVKKILKKYGYPPDMQQKAMETVLEQAKLMAQGIAE